MNVLEVNIKYLRIVGLFTGGRNDSKNNFMKLYRCYVLLAGYVLFSITFGGLYLYRSLDDLTTSMNGVIIVTTGICDSLLYISIGFGMEMTKSLCREIQSIVDQGKTLH